MTCFTYVCTCYIFICVYTYTYTGSWYEIIFSSGLEVKKNKLESLSHNERSHTTQQKILLATT